MPYKGTSSTPMVQAWRSGTQKWNDSPRVILWSSSKIKNKTCLSPVPALCPISWAVYQYLSSIRNACLWLRRSSTVYWSCSPVWCPLNYCGGISSLSFWEQNTSQGYPTLNSGLSTILLCAWHLNFPIWTWANIHVILQYLVGSRLNSPSLAALGLMHLLPALDFGVGMRGIAPADGYCVRTAGICVFKYQLIRRNGEFNTRVLEVCQLFAAWIIWHIMFWDVSLAAVTVTWIRVENFSVCDTML